jgi:hypothetical protein
VGQPKQALVATFAEPNTKAKSFHATVNWGDSSPSSGAQIKMLGPGRFSVRGKHRYRQPGTFNVVVTIGDAGGHTATASSTAIVLASKRR